MVDDIDVEDDEARQDDAFLEEEEEDEDDVSQLIDGEIAPDEEPLSAPVCRRDACEDLFAAGLVAGEGLRLYAARASANGFAPTEAAPSDASFGTSGAIAQLGERFNGIEEVVGSIPSGSTNQPSRERSHSLLLFESFRVFQGACVTEPWRNRKSSA